ncbi:MAG: S8 family serine peptidase [Oligoflexia bacterium]|nr:S8 family serine peptidase [Oligoflexia bacterium]
MDATYLKATLCVALSLSAVGCGGGGSVQSTKTNGLECTSSVIENSFLVEWKDQVPQEYRSHAIHPGSRVTHFTNINKDTLEKTILKPNADKVVLAEHDFAVQKSENLNLSACNTTSAWGPSDIGAQQAWALSNKKGEGVTVAVIDTGLDLSHPLLASQVWKNFSEIPNNNIDDDNNGLIDDVNGFNFFDFTADVTDTESHGTHVSGIIAGQAGDLNFTGIAPKAKIMPLKFTDPDGIGNVGAAISAMQYAYIHGAKVISASWGGNNCSSLLSKEINNAVLHGSVFVNAAGNKGRDLSRSPEWPAAYQIPGKITIGSMNIGQVLSNFSNYGQLVDIAAPGENILSTMPNNKLCSISGTSMATPFVSGVAALILSTKPTLSPVDVVNVINSTVSLGRYGVRTQGKLNAASAIESILP